jgi:hypothetical protein
MKCDQYSYSNGSISINTDPFMPNLESDFKTKAKTLGFDSEQITSSMQSNHMFMKYKSKIIDDSFYKNYNELCEHYPRYHFYLPLAGVTVFTHPSEVEKME